MLAEKTLPGADRLARPVGAAAVALGVVLLTLSPF
jgi:hypothetical protein